MTTNNSLHLLSDTDLLAATRSLLDQEQRLLADLLVHLGEIDKRRLYLDRAYPSMFAYCVGELGFSEDVTFNRIAVARAGRQFPEVIEAVRSSRVHLTGLRLLAPHLTDDNHQDLLAEAAGKPKRKIEEMVARLSPRPPAPSLIRKLPEPRSCSTTVDLPPAFSAPDPAARRDEVGSTAGAGRAVMVVKPLTEETYKVQFTASRRLRDKLRQAQDLLRHQVPDGNLATIVEKAVDLLIQDTEKRRFALGRKERERSEAETSAPPTRHVPNAVKRAVYERDGGQCAFVDDRGNRCPERGGLELDHVDGFARTRTHAVDRIRLLCRSHNAHAAERMYGREFMAEARRRSRATRTGTGGQQRRGPLGIEGPPAASPQPLDDASAHQPLERERPKFVVKFPPPPLGLLAF
jgi:hypothetical protein